MALQEIVWGLDKYDIIWI